MEYIFLNNSEHDDIQYFTAYLVLLMKEQTTQAPSLRELNKLKVAREINVSWEQIVSVGLNSNVPPLKS